MARLTLLLLVPLWFTGCEKVQITEECVDGYVVEHHKSSIRDDTTYVREWGFGKLIECKESQ